MDRYIVTSAQIDAYAGVEKAHYLNDNAQRLNKSLGDLTGITGFGFHVIEVHPGHATTELHKHYHEDECVFILEGEAEATIGGEVHRVRAGDFIGYRAGGAAHTLFNDGETLLKCIVVGQRLENDVVDYPRQGKRLYRNKNMPWNLVELSAVSEPQAGRKS